MSVRINEWKKGGTEEERGWRKENENTWGGETAQGGLCELTAAKEGGEQKRG